MTDKKGRTAKISGSGTIGWAEPGGPFVHLRGAIVGKYDTGRPLSMTMTPAEARTLAAALIERAEEIELATGPKWAPAPETP